MFKFKRSKLNPEVGSPLEPVCLRKLTCCLVCSVVSRDGAKEMEPTKRRTRRRSEVPHLSLAAVALERNALLSFGCRVASRKVAVERQHTTKMPRRRSGHPHLSLALIWIIIRVFCAWESTLAILFTHWDVLCFRVSLSNFVCNW